MKFCVETKVRLWATPAHAKWSRAAIGACLRVLLCFREAHRQSPSYVIRIIRISGQAKVF